MHDFKTDTADTGERENVSVSAGSTPPSWDPADSTSDLPPPILPFNEAVGSTLQIPQESQPVDFFRHLLDDNLMDRLVEETNRQLCM